jgi:hypothetical protein
MSLTTKCLALITAGASLAACAVQREDVPITTPFNESDFSWSSTAGDAALKGQAFMKTVGGEVKTCAGNEVILVPSNAYTREMTNIWRQRGVTRANPVRDPRYNNYRRVALCDAAGAFEFENLPPGPWMVNATVSWGVPHQYGVSQQGGYLMQEVSLADGQSRSLILTDRDMLPR